MKQIFSVNFTRQVSNGRQCQNNAKIYCREPVKWINKLSLEVELATHVVPQRGASKCVRRYFDREAITGMKHDTHTLVSAGDPERATDMQIVDDESDMLLVWGEWHVQRISPERVTAFRKYVCRGRLA